jgi:hypothetical protein
MPVHEFFRIFFYLGKACIWLEQAVFACIGLEKMRGFSEEMKKDEWWMMKQRIGVWPPLLHAGAGLTRKAGFASQKSESVFGEGLMGQMGRIGRMEPTKWRVMSGKWWAGTKSVRRGRRTRHARRVRSPYQFVRAKPMSDISSWGQFSRGMGKDLVPHYRKMKGQLCWATMRYEKNVSFLNKKFSREGREGSEGVLKPQMVMKKGPCFKLRMRMTMRWNADLGNLAAKEH